MSAAEKETLYRNTLLGLPGSEERFTEEQILAALRTYEGIDAGKLKQHLFYFLRQVVPVAEAEGLKWPSIRTIRPIPYWGCRGSSVPKQDARELLDCAPSPANGLCFCTGSVIGVRADNDLPGMVQPAGGSYPFYPSCAAPNGMTREISSRRTISMGMSIWLRVIRELLTVQRRRGVSLPMRPGSRPPDAG